MDIFNSKTLWDEFHDGDSFGDFNEFSYSKLPSVEYVSLPISEATLVNPKRHEIENAFLFCPKSQISLIKKVRIEIAAPLKNLRLYFIRIPSQMTISLKGGGHKLLCLSSGSLKCRIGLIKIPKVDGGGSKVLIGERGFMGGVRMVLANTDLIIKKGTLWSDEILVQGSNQHGIVDMNNGELIDFGRRKIVINEHVWIGRRSIVMPDTEMGKGSILGTGSVAVKKYPEFRVVVGNPGVVKGPKRNWSDNINEINELEKKFIEDNLQDEFTEQCDSEKNKNYISIFEKCKSLPIRLLGNWFKQS